MGKEIELIPFLERVMQRTTTHYQEDFQRDILRLQQAAQDTNDEHTFCWMARPTGTWIVPERDVFLRESPGHTVWTFYRDMSKDISAYRVVVTGLKDGTPLGTVQKLNYLEQVRRVEAHALPTVRVEITFESGQRREVPFGQYAGQREQLFNKYGAAKLIRYYPEDETELANVLAAEHHSQRKPRAKPTKKVPQPGGR